MPPYAHLAEQKVDLDKTASKVRAMRALGVPYSKEDVERAADDAKAQGTEIAKDLADNGANTAPDSELVAIIAYLQRLGKTGEPKAAPPAGSPVSMSGAH